MDSNDDDADNDDKKVDEPPLTIDTCRTPYSDAFTLPSVCFDEDVHDGFGGRLGFYYFPFFSGLLLVSCMNWNVKVINLIFGR